MTTLVLPALGDHHWDLKINAALTALNDGKAEKTQAAADISTAIASEVARANAAYDTSGAASTAVANHGIASDPHGDRADAASKYVAKSAVGTSATSVGPTLAAGSTGKYADAGHAHTVGTWLPDDNGLIWANYPPISAGTSTNPPIATVPGKLTLYRVLLRQPVSLNSILFGLSAVDAVGPISNSFFGIYDSNGTLVAQTADVSATLMSSATVKTVNFVTPYAAPAGEYFIAFLINGTYTTGLQFKSSGGGVTANAGLSVPHLVMSSMLSGLTALPASISLASQTTALITGGWGAQWYGLK